MSSGRIGSACCRHTGPLSSPAVRRMIETPVSRVAGHDRALDRRRAAPARQQRRMDVEDLVVGEQRLLISAPKAQTMTTSGRAAAIRARRVRRVDVLRLEERRCRARGAASATGGGVQPAPAARGPVGPGDDELRAVRACPRGARRTAAANVAGAEVDGARHGGYAAASSRSRRVRIASLRWSRGVRSRIRTPSRWSISCWMTRASRPEASIEDRLAVGVLGAARARGSGARRRRATPGRLRQPSSNVSSSLAAHSSSGLTSALDRARRPRRGRRARGAGRRPASRRGRCRARRP